MSRLLPMVIIAMVLVGAVVSCGGGSNESPLVAGGNTSGAERCQNAYYSRIIGRYEGEAVFKVRAADGSEAAACTWEISMDVKHGGSPVVCDLIATITAPVDQTIVLASDDGQAFQCFADESVRMIEDPNSAKLPFEYSDSLFPVEFKMDQNFSLNAFGPYFGDENVTAAHYRLLDRGWVNAFILNGSGLMELRTSTGFSFPFEGSLNQDISK